MWSSTVIFLCLFVLKFALNENSISENKLSLVNASLKCKEQGLILESNENEIQNRISTGNGNPVVWIGKYETFTGWAYIKGCFEIQINPISKPLNVTKGTERNICQNLCKDERYFGIKKHFCICLDDIRLFTKCKCNMNECVIIWEHYHPVNVQDIDTDAKCIAAQNCNKTKLVRTYKPCHTSYRAVCDDDRDGNSRFHKESASFCHSEGSFLKWYTDSVCSVWLSTVPQHWTSGRRYSFTNIVRKNDIIQPHQLLSCHSINKQGITSYNADDCKTNEFYFLCRNESSIDDLKPAIIYPPETTANESSTAGAVVGSFIAVIAVTVLIIVAVIFLKRRAKNKNDAPSKAETSLGYKFRVTQNSNIKTHKTNYDYPTVAEINNDKSVNVNYSIAKPIKDEKGGDYSFAQPLDSGGDYAYNSDYDHFNSPVKQSNDSSQYTSADQAVKIYGDKKGTYDHLSSFERKTIDKESCSNSNYDHLPNITGSDPTYDVSGNVIHDDSDKYDHLPPNFNADASSDYQSTRLFPGSVKDDAYDHFEMKE